MRIYDEIFRKDAEKEAYRRLTNFDSTDDIDGVTKRFYLPRKLRGRKAGRVPSACQLVRFIKEACKTEPRCEKLLKLCDPKQIGESRLWRGGFGTGTAHKDDGFLGKPEMDNSQHVLYVSRDI